MLNKLHIYTDEQNVFHIEHLNTSPQLTL